MRSGSNSTSKALTLVSILGVVAWKADIFERRAGILELGSAPDAEQQSNGCGGESVSQKLMMLCFLIENATVLIFTYVSSMKVDEARILTKEEAGSQTDPELQEVPKEECPHKDLKFAESESSSSLNLSKLSMQTARQNPSIEVSRPTVSEKLGFLQTFLDSLGKSIIIFKRPLIPAYPTKYRKHQTQQEKNSN